jgi:hypothetical protein
MNSPASACLRASTKFGIVFCGWLVAFAIAYAAVVVRQHATQGPDAQASAGMYAAGDAMLGTAVFGMIALLPIGLSLYWLRPIAWFWSVLAWGALGFALTGLGALAESHWAVYPANVWPLFVAQARIALMPLTAAALLVCALFAPRVRHRWMLLGAVATDVTIFAGVIVLKFILPQATH